MRSHNIYIHGMFESAIVHLRGLAGSKIVKTSAKNICTINFLYALCHLQELGLDLQGYAPRGSILTQSKFSCMSHKQSIDILLSVQNVSCTYYVYTQVQCTSNSKVNANGQ